MSPHPKDLEPSFLGLKADDLHYALSQAVNVVVTDADGVIRYANENFCTTTGYVLEEVIGQTHRLINSGYHPPEFFKAMWDTIAAGHIWRGQIRNQAKNGSIYWVQTAIVPFIGTKGRPDHYMSIHTDITDQKQAEAQVQALNEQLEEQVKQRTLHLEALNLELSKLIAGYQAQAQALREQFLHCCKILNLDPAVLEPSHLVTSPDQHKATTLSDREMEVLTLVVEGKTNKEIAQILCVTVHTAKAHVSSILQKLDIQDRTQAAVMALKSGWIKPLRKP